MFELEVLVEILLIDIIVVHDLEEFLELFGEVLILSRFLKFERQIIEGLTRAWAKEVEGFMTPNRSS
jgi:hypothetical protein